MFLISASGTAIQNADLCNSEGIVFSGHPSVRPFILPFSARPLTPISCDIVHLYSLPTGGISMKLGTIIHRVSGRC